MNRRFLFLAACTMGLIWFLSGRPAGDLPLPGGWDKPAHFSEYALLGYFLARGLGGRRAALSGFVLAVGYGLLDEFHQSFVPGRDPSALDLLADAAGAMAGSLLGRLSTGGGEDRRGGG
jgi:VanZ family protein